MKLKMIFIVLLGVYLMGCTNLSSKKPDDTYSSLSEFIHLVQSKKVSKREAFVQKEIRNLAKTCAVPQSNGNEVVFFYRNPNAESVNVTGDLNYWKDNGFPMENIPGTSVFFLKKPLEKNARIKYKFIINGNTPILDPLNRDTESTPFGNDSVFEMSGYNYKETRYHEDIPHGKIITKNIENNTIFGSKNQRRKIQIYLPPDYSEDKKYKAIYFCDGSEYVEQSHIPNVLDYMIDKGEIEPIVGIFVSWIEREKEYIYDTKQYYLEFLTEELIPMMEDDYSLVNTREGRIAMGPSNGGDFVTYVGAVASDRFKYIFNQSGSPHFGAFGTIDFGMNYEKDNLPIRVFSVVGKYEKNYNRINAQRFHDYLKNNPSVLGEKYILYPQGHTYTMWGDSFREGILWLLYNKEID